MKEDTEKIYDIVEARFEKSAQAQTNMNGHLLAEIKSVRQEMKEAHDGLLSTFEKSISHLKDDIQPSLERIEKQTTKTNGRVSLIEKILWITGGILFATGVLKYPMILHFFKLL